MNVQEITRTPDNMTENNAVMPITVMSSCPFRVREDMGITEDSKDKLLTDMEDLTVSLMNLAITGRAVSHLHNGDLLYDLKGNLLVSVLCCDCNCLGNLPSAQW